MIIIRDDNILSPVWAFLLSTMEITGLEYLLDIAIGTFLFNFWQKADV
jgi:hypothetical protein